MSSRLTKKREGGQLDGWHRVPQGHRIAILVCVMLALLGFLSSLRIVGASSSGEMSVGFVVTDGSEVSSSSSSSSSSESSSSSSSESSSVRADDTNPQPAGGNSRRTDDILAAIRTEDIPQILTQKMLPGCDIYINRMLIPQRSPHPVSFCPRNDASAHAAPSALTMYEDVPAGIWYEEAVATFLSEGILDASKSIFRGTEGSTRAEFAKVLGMIHGGVRTTEPNTMHFDDVPSDTWFTTFVEFAGTKGWMRGYNNCIGSHPCNVMPSATISRAEAAVMIVRFFDLQLLSSAPSFKDVDPDAWYAETVAIAADHCLLQGIGTERYANPNGRLHRAEMMVILDRARKNLVYGTDCRLENVSSSASSSTDSMKQ